MPRLSNISPATTESSRATMPCAAFRDAFARKNRCLSSSVRNFADADITSLVAFGLTLAEREVCLPRRLRELARRCRHGRSTRSAARLCSGFRPRRILPTNMAALPATPGLDLLEMFDAAGRRRPLRTLRRRLEPRCAIRHRPFRAQEYLSHRAGYVPDRNGSAG